jgi:anti-sigma factor RsiW
MRDGAAAEERVHIDTCAACSERAAAIDADARYAAAVLAMNDDVDTTSAYARFAARPRRVERSRGRFGFPAGIAAAAVLAIALATTPLGSHAADLLSIFRPTTQAPINLSSTDLTSMSKATALEGYKRRRRPGIRFACHTADPRCRMGRGIID